MSSHLFDVAVPTPFATELPPTNTGQHLEEEHVHTQMETPTGRNCENCFFFIYFITELEENEQLLLSQRDELFNSDTMDVT